MQAGLKHLNNMKHNKYRSLLLFPFIAVTLLACKRDPITRSTLCSGTPASSHPKAAEYQAIINKYVQKGLPGISVSVIDQQGRWSSASGKADIARNVNMEPCHLGKIASITKMVLATLAMKLVEEGKLNLSDPLTKWLPKDVTENFDNAGRITLLYLLTHQTGLTDYYDDQRFFLEMINNPNKMWSARDLIKIIYGDKELFRPGTRASYSNTNTVLAAMMIEGSTGRSHAALMREKIFTPLRMTNTYYQGHDVLPEGIVAQGYVDLFKEDVLVNVSQYNFGYGNGSGGLVSNVFDMQTFIRALFAQKTILTQQSLDQMRQWYTEANTFQEFGIGLIKQGSAYGHGGGDLGYTSKLHWYPDKNASLAVFTNVGTSRDRRLTSIYYEFFFELESKLLD